MRKKRQGGKNLVPEISGGSTIRGYMVRPRPPPETITKNENFEKTPCEKKKAGSKLIKRGGKLTQQLW